jgi:DNA-binding transcriptional LysR family regulator
MPFAAPAPWTTKMTLTQLRYLVAIADSGLNITHAAGRVYATQPGLSKQIKRLEDELGFLIFKRRGRSLEALTTGGAQVLGHARRVLSEAGNIRALAIHHKKHANAATRPGELTASNCTQ